jgi:hypothetical protein
MAYQRACVASRSLWKMMLFGATWIMQGGVRAGVPWSDLRHYTHNECHGVAYQVHPWSPHHFLGAGGLDAATPQWGVFWGAVPTCPSISVVGTGSPTIHV